MDEDRLYRLVGGRLRTIRERKRPRMSQQTLADRVDMTRASIVNIEAGRQRPPLHVIWLIAETLDVTLVDLLPTREEFAVAGEPVTLDAATVNQIVEAANGDAKSRDLLSDFISRAKSTVKEKGKSNDQTTKSRY